MKVHEIFESDWFAMAVHGGLEVIFGKSWKDAELASYAVEEDLDQREALVVTPIGLLTFTLSRERREGLKPVTVTVTPWSEAPAITLSVELYPRDARTVHPVVELDGVEKRTITVPRTAEQAADFAREYIAQRSRAHPQGL